MTDIEICNEYKYENIKDIAKKISLCEEDLILYGDNKAKIKYNSIKSNYNGNLILVSAISPTPYGEGKTTVTIGLNDALRRIKANSIAVIREPSMGPVFGMKGGATGGGYSQVVPMDEINLHFTGDFHAISSANNLLCAAIDNHIYQGNALDIQKVNFHRCLDVNDRALRKVNMCDREDRFTITAASEIMALFCLAKDIDDLKERLGSIIIGYNSKGEEILAKELKTEGSLTALLKDAIKPNLVQSLEGNPVIIHGGPFANIAHGCNTVIATNTGLKLADYVVTEAGFGADLGAEKFFDIKCRTSNLKPKCSVLVATLKALKYHGGVKKDNIYEENIDALKEGIKNLKKHYDNLSKYGLNVIVALNKYDTDTEKELNYIIDYCKENNMEISLCDSYLKGGEGAIDLAEKVIDLCNDESSFKVLYEDNISIKDKIETICKEIYGASKVVYTDEINEKIEALSKFSNYPVCIAKTQYSLSDDAKKLGVPKNFEMNIRDIYVYNGAKFIVVLMGNIMTMPGLPKKPCYLNIDVKDDKITGVQ